MRALLSLSRVPTMFSIIVKNVDGILLDNELPRSIMENSQLCFQHVLGMQIGDLGAMVIFDVIICGKFSKMSRDA